jgi:hypothetical protein
MWKPQTGPAGKPAAMDKESGVSNELKNADVRLRPRVVDQDQPQPGRIAFDVRGNAVYEWSADNLTLEGEEGVRARRKALDHPGLAVAEEEQKSNAAIQNNAKGLRLGYNPYESGLLPRKTVAKKKDLRELSRWLELKKRVGDGGEK